jgi:putative DNA primase/helicase
MDPLLFDDLQHDADEIERAIGLLFDPNAIVELRALNALRAGTVSGYFDGTHRPEMARAAQELSGKAPGVYATLNPVQTDLIARANNRAKPFAKDTTKDNEIERRVWLPIDFDPERPSGISATDAEHQAALDRAKQCRDYLRKLGWPDPIYADSGNGAHLLSRIELLNDQASTELVKRVLESLASRFSDNVVDVDRSVFNAARIWKLYGTLSAKGDHTPERPHRISRILEVPQHVKVVPIDTLKALASQPTPSAKPQAEDRDEVFRALTKPSGNGFDLEQWIDEHDLPVVGQKPWNDGGDVWVLNPCPWNSDHTNSAAVVGRLANGAVFAKCHHNGCAGKSWHDLRDVYEPGWRDKEENVKPLEAVNDPHRLARNFLESECSHPDGSILKHHNGGWYRWDGAAFCEEPVSDLDSRLTDSIKREFDRESMEAQRRSDGKRIVARQVTTAVVSNVRLALRSQVLVPSFLRLPCWIGGEGPWNAADVLPALNGLFHIPSLAEGVDDHLKPTPRYFSTFALDYEIRLDAPQPVLWLKFMNQLWGEDPQCIETLQEFMGYIVTQDTSQHKTLTTIGPKRCGKGVISRVTTGLIGSKNVAGTTLSSLRGPFGLEDLLGKALAIIPDGRLRGQTDAVMERMLSITGEDMLTVDRKNKTSVNVKLPTRLILNSNEMSRFDDASGALVSRMICLPLTVSFYGKEDKTLTERLLAERAGILLWALAGLRRLRERGCFVQPESGNELLRELEDLSSPVGEFVRECCKVGPSHQVARQDIYDAYVKWCERSGRKFPDAPNTFGRNLRAVVPRLSDTQPRDGDERIRCYEGIALATP